MRLLFIASVSFLLVNFGTLTYAIRQGYGQMLVLYRAVDVEKAISHGNYDKNQVVKIRLIEQVRNFAFDSLGLRRNSSYTKIYDQKGKPLIWLVVACEPYQFKAKNWEFPLVGSFTYKGFFSQKNATHLAQSLANQGYDTLVRPVSAWSTLGLFADPILSEMLKLDEGDLAELIIHELTHGTIYLKNSVEYNENLANFIGQEGAKRFLKTFFGLNSPQYKKYVLSLEAEREFVSKIIEFAQQLDALYKQGGQLAEKKEQKIKQFKQWVLENDNFDSLFREKFARKQLNNAYFYAYLQYNESVADFQSEFESKADGNLVRYLAYLKLKHGTRRLIF